MIFGYAAKARRQLVLHAETRIGRQDNSLIVIALARCSRVRPKVACDTALTAGDVGAFYAAQSMRSCGAQSSPKTVSARCSPHICARGAKRATNVRTPQSRSDGRARPPRAPRPRSCRSTDTANQFSIRSEPAMLCQLGAIEATSAATLVEKPRLRFPPFFCPAHRHPEQSDCRVASNPTLGPTPSALAKSVFLVSARISLPWTLLPIGLFRNFAEWCQHGEA